jgi:hypothetical protein
MCVALCGFRQWGERLGGELFPVLSRDERPQPHSLLDEPSGTHRVPDAGYHFTTRAFPWYPVRLGAVPSAIWRITALAVMPFSRNA